MDPMDQSQHHFDSTLICHEEAGGIGLIRCKITSTVYIDYCSGYITGKLRQRQSACVACRCSQDILQETFFIQPGEKHFKAFEKLSQHDNNWHLMRLFNDEMPFQAEIFRPEGAKSGLKICPAAETIRL